MDDPTVTDDVMFIEMNRLREDIEVEYYSNVCDPLESDDDVPQTPKRYHRTHIYQVLEKSYLKGNYDTRAAAYWGSKAQSDILLAKGQAVIPTIGEQSYRQKRRRRLPNIQYNPRSGVFTGRTL